MFKVKGCRVRLTKSGLAALRRRKPARRRGRRRIICIKKA
jgi:hypothetical protein